MKTLNTLIMTASLLLAGTQFCLAGTGGWNSRALSASISYRSTQPSQVARDQNGRCMTVVYLENLGFEKLGQNTNEEDVAWLLAQGYQVLELDYRKSPKAVSPLINLDIIDINDALNRGVFCDLSSCSSIRSYILFEGYRIRRDLAYFKDDPSVYNWPGAGYTEGDSLYMDVVYPANPSHEVPCVLSFSYSNSSGMAGQQHQRLFLGYTLAMFDDSFLEGAPARGMAWAIADHPKYADWGNGKPVGGDNKTYASYETNPDASQKVKSAIRTLRAEGRSLGLDGQIGVYGFSRGSTAASLAVGDRYVEEFETAGLHIGESSGIQAAALGSGVFDYTLIYELTGDGDKNLENGCPKAWGPLDSNRESWERQGAKWMVETSASAPVFFFYNTTDEQYYQSQIASFREWLDDRQIYTEECVDYSRGHAVPADTVSLERIYRFFETQFARPADALSGKRVGKIGTVSKVYSRKGLLICRRQKRNNGQENMDCVDLQGRSVKF